MPMEKEEAPWAQGQAPGSLFILDTSRYVARGILAMVPAKAMGSDTQGFD